MQDLNKSICYRCKAHDSYVTDFKSGEIVCQNCGLVLEERIIDDTYEKRNFGSENGGNKGESRVGGPMKATEGNNLGSNIVIKDKNGYMKKMRGVNNTYNQSPIDRGFDEIDKYLGNKEISKILIEETKEIYSLVTKVKKMKGRNLKCMILAMYFCASKKNGLPRSFKEIADMFGIEEKKIKKAFNYIKNVSGYNLSPEKLNETVKSYIQRYNELKKEDVSFIKLATEIAFKINESCLLEGRNPKTITALSLLIASKLVKTKCTNRKSVCEGNCSENTLDNAYDKIKDFLDKIIPENYHSQIKDLSIK